MHHVFDVRRLGCFLNTHILPFPSLPSSPSPPLISSGSASPPPKRVPTDSLTCPRESIIRAK